MTVYVNGQWLAADAPGVPAGDRGVMLGDGLFETLAVRSGAIRRVPAHLVRLRDSARALEIGLALDDAALTDILAEAVARNGVADGMVRLTITRGAAQSGLAPMGEALPTVIVTATARPPQVAPVRAVISRVTRRNEHSPLARLKTTNYLDNILAAGEARERGADEAVLLNTAGRLAEATIANLFVVIDGRLVTPPIAEGALPGIMRAQVIAAEDVDERPLDPAVIGDASEALLTNSGAIRALVAIDGAPVGSGTPGPVHRRLQEIV